MNMEEALRMIHLTIDNDSDVAAFSDSSERKKKDQRQYSSALNGQQASTADTGEVKTHVADDDSDDTGFVVFKA